MVQNILTHPMFLCLQNDGRSIDASCQIILINHLKEDTGLLHKKQHEQAAGTFSIPPSPSPSFPRPTNHQLREVHFSIKLKMSFYVTSPLKSRDLSHK